MSLVSSIQAAFQAVAADIKSLYSSAGNQKMMLSASVASTSGVAIDFTGIPSWAKRVTVIFDAVSTSGTSNWQIQTGVSSPQTSGYNGADGIVASSGASSAAPIATGFGIRLGSALATVSGQMCLQLMGGNTWVSSHCMTDVEGTPGFVLVGGGRVSLSGKLGVLRVTTVNGTDVFDSGNISILVEGY